MIRMQIGSQSMDVIGARRKRYTHPVPCIVVATVVVLCHPEVQPHQPKVPTLALALTLTCAAPSLNSRTRHGRHDVALPLHGAHLSSTTLHCHLTVHSARLSTSPCHFTVPVHRERSRPTLPRYLLGVNNPALLFYGAHSASTTLPCHFTVPAYRQSRYLFRPYYRRLS
jgi:hypothetical protein